MANKYKVTKFQIGKDGYAGIGELLKSDGMKSLVESTAAQIANNAGTGYASDVHLSSQRWNGNVYPVTNEAAQEIYESNSILKAMR